MKETAVAPATAVFAVNMHFWDGVNLKKLPKIRNMFTFYLFNLAECL
jgi:hypothetical protein